MAPGRPGDDPRWYSSAKSGVGTAVNPIVSATNLVWFTLSRGVLSEVYHPRLDNAATRELSLIVTAGDDYHSDEQEDAEHRIELPEPLAPLYRLTNTCRRGRYRIVKTIFSHPFQDAVLQRTSFTPLTGAIGDHRLFAFLDPHLNNQGAEGTAWLGDYKGVPMLMAECRGHTLALACSAGWVRGSAGFVGTSDGRHDLKKHGELRHEYDRAEQGNVSLIGEIDLAASGGGFLLSLGFGPDPDEAGHRALRGLLDDFDRLRDEYVRGWREWQDSLIPLDRDADPGGRDLYRTSTAVLRTHAAKAVPGAIIASLSVPWGEAKGDDQTLGTGGYHLVWPRDHCEAASGFLACGAKDDALRALRYLQATQDADGHWPQNMWISGATFWGGIQLGETAIAILLADHLRREGGLDRDGIDRYWPMIRRAVAYLARSGPSTQQDRWENEHGYTPFTLVLVIVAFLIAAELADEYGEAEAAAYLRETADAWNAAIESWLYVTDTELARRVGVDGYYIRTFPAELDENSTPMMGRLRPRPGDVPEKRGIPITEIVSPDALALVRFGLRAPDDPRILNTVKVVDAVNKVETPFGPSWHRYNGDGYGEHEDGSPLADMSKRGFGRAWPLLTGERAHYELLADRKEEAVRLLRAMEAFADDGGMISEQVWDTDDIPERGLFQGRPTGSAMPLVWAHAEYIKLRRSLRDGRVFDLPPQTVRRYLVEKVTSDLAIWRFEHQRHILSPGEVLRIELLEPAVVEWSADGWKTTRETPTHDTTLGIHVADLETKRLSAGDRVEFRLKAEGLDRDQRKTFAVKVVEDE